MKPNTLLVRCTCSGLGMLAPVMRHFAWETLWQELLKAQRLLSSRNDGRFRTNSKGMNHLDIPPAFKPAEIVALAECLWRTRCPVDTCCVQVVLADVDSRAHQDIVLAQQAAYTVAACLLLRALASLPSVWRVKLKLRRDQSAARRQPLRRGVSPRGINLVMAALAEAVGRCASLTNVEVVVEQDGE